NRTAPSPCTSPSAWGVAGGPSPPPLCMERPGGRAGVSPKGFWLLTPGRDVTRPGQRSTPESEASDAGEVHEVLRADRALRCHRVVRRPSVPHGLHAPPHAHRGRTRSALRLLLWACRRLLLRL